MGKRYKVVSVLSVTRMLSVVTNSRDNAILNWTMKLTQVALRFSERVSLGMVEESPKSMWFESNWLVTFTYGPARNRSDEERGSGKAKNVKMR